MILDRQLYLTSSMQIFYKHDNSSVNQTFSYRKLQSLKVSKGNNELFKSGQMKIFTYSNALILLWKKSQLRGFFPLPVIITTECNNHQSLNDSSAHQVYNPKKITQSKSPLMTTFFLKNAIFKLLVTILLSQIKQVSDYEKISWQHLLHFILNLK